ncbi:MAG: uroporphyrinogen decarboxylase [Verrucomicrobia bacterium]|nr:uroporphyrinogen decarboxylase [Verrucomicrobiota bacterium]
MTPRERFLAATRCQPLDRPPIWLMRQAGRYLPEYRELKTKYDFLTMVQTPELATEVTLQPLKRFPLDAAIIFSDILVIPEALGQGYHFRETGGIGMDYALDAPDKITALNCEGITERLDYVRAALKMTRKELGDTQALLGFCGSPWTLATYMIEGGSSKDFSKIKRFALEEPQQFQTLMEKLAEACTEYLKLQIEAGVDAVQIFDSWGALCPHNCYQEWSLCWIEKIISALDPKIPVILYAKGMGHRATQLAATGASVLSLDWTVSIPEIRKKLDSKIALQGNLDPTVLTTSPEITRREAESVLSDGAGEPGHIFNLGHGMLPSAKIACVEALMDVVTQWNHD